MRRRLYLLLPDVPSARATLDDLLLARVPERDIHVLARRGTDLGDLPEANVLQKTDIVHGAEVGLVIGGFAGALGGVLAVVFPPAGIHLQLVTVLIAAVIGAVLGAWVSSLAGSAVPNSRLEPFQFAIERGAVLLMADVPLHRVADVMEAVRRRHPEAEVGGTEPTIPAFP